MVDATLTDFFLKSIEDPYRADIWIYDDKMENSCQPLQINLEKCHEGIHVHYKIAKFLS